MAVTRFERNAFRAVTDAHTKGSLGKPISLMAFTPIRWCLHPSFLHDWVLQEGSVRGAAMTIKFYLVCMELPELLGLPGLPGRWTVL